MKKHLIAFLILLLTAVAWYFSRQHEQAPAAKDPSVIDLIPYLNN